MSCSQGVGDGRSTAGTDLAPIKGSEPAHGRPEKGLEIEPVRKGDMMLGERTYMRDARRNPLKGLACGLLAAILFAACRGDNLFVDFGASAVDSNPRVEILDPPPGQTTAKPLTDSLVVTVDLFDTDGITRVDFEGLALRGDVGLGTDVAVQRFTSKTVSFLDPVTDTILTRFL